MRENNRGAWGILKGGMFSSRSEGWIREGRQKGVFPCGREEHARIEDLKGGSGVWNRECNEVRGSGWERPTTSWALGLRGCSMWTWWQMPWAPNPPVCCTPMWSCREHSTVLLPNHHKKAPNSTRLVCTSFIKEFSGQIPFKRITPPLWLSSPVLDIPSTDPALL